MNILFLTNGRLNNINDRDIYTDLIREFRDNGHNLYTISPLDRRLNLPTQYTNEYGVNCLRIKMGSMTKTSLIERGISTIMLEHIFIQGIKEYYRDVKFDLVLYITPPVTFAKVVKFVKDRDDAKSYLLLKDIFPQNAVDLGMFGKKSPIYRFFRYKENKLYEVSDYIGCMSQANVDYLRKHNIEIASNKIEVCPNSIEPLDILKDREEIVSIRKKYNIPLNKTIFLYGGNLGKPQGIDFLMECLKANKNNDKVHFIIVGSGTESNKLKNFLDTEEIPNTQLFSQMPTYDYEIFANSCDVGLIFLDHRFTIPNFPSRILSYMQCSKPVLAATDDNTDIGKVIESGGFGFWCESNDVNKFNKYVDKLSDKNLRGQMGEKARSYLENNYTVKHSYDIIMKHFT